MISLLVKTGIGSCHLLLTLYFTAIFVSAFAQTPGHVIDSVAGQVDNSGYVLFAPADSSATYLISKTGAVRKRWQNVNVPGMAVYVDSVLNLYRAEDTLTLVSPGNIGEPCQYPGGIVRMYDSNSNIIWSYVISTPGWQQTHDIYPMPNGHVLADVWQYIPHQTALNAGRNPIMLHDTSGLWSGMVVELKPHPKKHKADSIWSWRFWDHLDTSTNPSSIAAHPEWLDVNDTGTVMGYIDKNADSPNYTSTRKWHARHT